MRQEEEEAGTLPMVNLLAVLKCVEPISTDSHWKHDEPLPSYLVLTLLLDHQRCPPVHPYPQSMGLCCCDPFGKAKRILTFDWSYWD